MLHSTSWELIAANSSFWSCELSHLVVPTASNPYISSPIRLHPALRNSALSLPVLAPLRPIPVMPDGQQPLDDFFPGVVFAPMLRRLACSRNQNPARAPGGSGGRVLPIVLRGTSWIDIGHPLSMNQCCITLLRLESSLQPNRSHAARVSTFCRSCSSAIAFSPEPSRLRTQ